MHCCGPRLGADSSFRTQRTRTLTAKTQWKNRRAPKTPPCATGDVGHVRLGSLIDKVVGLAHDAGDWAGGGGVEALGHAAGEVGFASGGGGVAHGFGHKDGVLGFGYGGVHQDGVGA